MTRVCSLCSISSGSLGARHALPVEHILHNTCAGARAPATPDAVTFSTAAYAALDPCRDIHLLAVRHCALAFEKLAWFQSAATHLLPAVGGTLCTT